MRYIPKHHQTQTSKRSLQVKAAQPDIDDTRVPTLALLLPLILVVITVIASTGCGSKEDQTSDQTAFKIQQSQPHHPEFPPAPAPLLQAGHDVFAEVCHKCHIESEYAPTIDDPRAWNHRLRRNGDISLFSTHAIEGYRDMEAKGGKAGEHLTDDQVKQAVAYMLAVVIPEATTVANSASNLKSSSETSPETIETPSIPSMP